MNKRGIILVVSLLVVLLLATLLASLYFQSISENQLARRFVNSTRAFWLAEAGVAKALSELSGPGSVNGSLDNPDYTYSAAMSHLSDNYYKIESTGSVLSGGAFTRKVAVTVRTGAVNPEKFQYGIETTTDLVVRGSVEINPSDSFKEFSTLDFADLFGISKVDMRAGAAHLYDTGSFAEPVDRVTWVDVPAGETLSIAGNLAGSGVLVINGNAHFSGTVNFNGIIYVIGELTMTGDVATYGSIMAESSATVDTELRGNVAIHYDVGQITNALSEVEFLAKEVVSWQELY
ncbi:MAG: hypothetical protein A3G38_00705 [Omnitrophica WOR_2 bacterium RIFCSPLOWO2_12_FULL_51_8]|nr:MAG: hypothetical protein A3G38_00705 [Omnitrophica WOR_2 bacterium RIFCSPLOWO2_12_FULL_51_8]